MDLFPNDGSFLERFKQMQGGSEPSTAINNKNSGASAQPVSIPIKQNCSASAPPKPAAPPAPVNGKLAFSLKPKAKLVITPLKFKEEEGEDEEPEQCAKKQKLDNNKPGNIDQSLPAPPADPEVLKVADKLARFVAKTGRQFEDITRQKNPTDPRFGFLFNVHSAEYKYYQHRLAEEEASLSNTNQEQKSSVPSPSPSANYQMPAEALYISDAPQAANSSASESADSLRMMEFYMKKAAQDECRKPPKQSPDEMPPPPSVLSPCSASAQKRGHHMGDYIPQEELERFMAKCSDASTQKLLLEAAEKARIQADNIGHRLLSKMGWKEGDGLGSAKGGRADPISAGSVKLNNLGIGAEQPGEISSQDDIYEQYKKRMMLGYKHRPNPLNNPRKAYY